QVGILRRYIQGVAYTAGASDLNATTGERGGIRRVETGNRVVLFLDRSGDVVAKAQAQRQATIHVPTVLDEFTHFAMAVLWSDQCRLASGLVVIAHEHRRKCISSRARCRARGIRLKGIDVEFGFARDLECAPVAAQKIRAKFEIMRTLRPG